jgi:hypothetical protein
MKSTSSVHATIVDVSNPPNQTHLWLPSWAMGMATVAIVNPREAQARNPMIMIFQGATGSPDERFDRAAGKPPLDLAL